MALLGRGVPVGAHVIRGQRSAVQSGAASMSTTSAVTAGGHCTAPGDCSMSTTTGIVASGQLLPAYAAAAMSTTTTCTPAGLLTPATGAAAMTTATEVTAAGHVGAGVTAMSTTTEVTAAGLLTPATGAAAMSTTGTVTASGQLLPAYAAAAMSTTTDLTAAGHCTAPGLSGLTTTTTLATSGHLLAHSSASGMTTTTTTTGAGRWVKVGHADTLATYTEMIGGGSVAHQPTPPAISDVAERLYQALGAQTFNDDTVGWPMRHLCEAVAAPLASVEALAGDTDDDPFTDEYRATYGRTSAGWSQVLDGVRCPDADLSWLGQFVGVAALRGETPDALRARVRDTAGWRRGTLETVTAVAKAYMTGSKSVTITERLDGSAYRLGVYASSAEVPDVEAFHAAVRAAVPAGIVVVFQVLANWRWLDLENAYDGKDWTDLEADYAGQTWADVDNHLAVI